MKQELIDKVETVIEKTADAIISECNLKSEFDAEKVNALAALLTARANLGIAIRINKSSRSSEFTSIQKKHQSQFV